MIFLTALFGALVGFAAVYVIAQRIRQKYGLQADVSRRLQKFKDDTAEKAAKSAKRAPRRVALTLADIPFADRTIKPLLEMIKQKLLSFAPTDIATMLERKIMLAGKKGVWHVNQCVMAWIGSIAACAVVAVIFFADNPELFLIQKILIGFIGAVVGATDHEPGQTSVPLPHPLIV